VTEQARDRKIEKLASLADPVRRALYEVVAQRAPDAVSRDQAAAATGVRRGLAAFHLDKLVASGLLEPIYRRLSGRRGPGAGRPAKLYRRSDETLEISLPERRYDLLATFAVQALAGESGGPTAERARQLAREYGRDLGRQARTAHKRGQPRWKPREAISSVLSRLGYEPRGDADGDLHLKNCPFDSLVAQYRSTVCQINLALQEGLVEGLDASGQLRAELQPAPGWCCVRLVQLLGS
jgi:predicted ArsR family transcriptional regulator